ncbi:MAG: CDP-alcohol phosphatidyltransferase family protein [Patescibacteria group bacterium]
MNLTVFTNSLTQKEILSRDKFWGPKISKKVPSPNFLTIIRIVGSIFLFVCKLDIAYFFLIAIFLLLTDYFDGIIARTQNRETLFGKWADPIADRMLLVSVIHFLYFQDVIFWKPIILVILMPEVLLIILGLIHFLFGTMIIPKPTIWGRLKFVFYCFGALGFLIRSYWIADVLFVMGIFFACVAVLNYARYLQRTHNQTT